MTLFKKTTALFVLATAFFLMGTHAASAATCNSAVLNGYVNPNGYPTQAWFEYGTNSGSVSSGGGTKTASQTFTSPSYYTQSVSGLSENTTYYFRAAFSNQAGTAYGAVNSFQTPPCGGAGGNQPVVTTNSATNISNSYATLNGYVDTKGTTDTVRWFEYGRSSSNLDSSTSQLNITSSGNVSASISNLSSNTTYYFRISARNAQGTVQGSVLQFTTNNGGGTSDVPVVNTRDASNINNADATLNGYVDTLGISNTSRWFEYGRSSGSLAYSTNRTNVSGATNVSAYVSGLSANTTYYFRIVAENNNGISRGSVYSFTTTGGGGDNLPSVTTRSATNVENSSATLNGYVDTNGGGSVERWFEYGRSSGSLSYSTSRSTVGYSGDASAYISGLSNNTTYYFRIVAQNDAGVVRGNILSFTTGNGGGGDNLPSVTTRSATNVENSSATLNGYVDTNGGGSVERWFEYGRSSGSLSYSTSRSTVGYSGDASAYISGLSNNTTYYFRIVAQNDVGVVRGNILSFTTGNGGGGDYGDSPIVTTRSATNVTSDTGTINGFVDPNGGSDTYGWFEYGRSSSNLNISTSHRYQGSDSSNIAAALTGLSSDTTYYYRAVGQNSRGTTRGTILSFTTGRGGGTSGQTPTAITTLPTNITAYSATFNSLILQGGNEATSAWFEWGTTQSLGRRTVTKNVGEATSVRHAESVSTLSPGTTYYYRVVAENGYGRSYGTLQKFTAKSAYVAPKPTPKPTPKPVTPVVTPKPTIIYADGVASLVMLTITGEGDSVQKGGSQTYQVTWRNKSNQDLDNVVLRILVPNSLSFVSADAGTYSKVENTHTLEIGTLRAGEFGEMSIVLKGTGALIAGDLVVTTANLVYTDESNVQGDALAYVTQRGSDNGSVLGASAAGGSFPFVLLGWLLLIILLIILIILCHHLYKRMTKNGNNA